MDNTERMRGIIALMEAVKPTRSDLQARQGMALLRRIGGDQLIAGMGQVRRIDLINAGPDDIGVAFNYASPGEFDGSKITEIDVMSFEKHSLGIEPRWEDPEEVELPPDENELAPWLSEAMGLHIAEADISFVDYNYDDNPWFSFDGDAAKPFLAFTSLMAKTPEVRKLLLDQQSRMTIWARG